MLKSDLIDAIDLLTEVRNLNEAAYMAVHSVSDARQRNALAHILGSVGDQIAHVENLLTSALPAEDDQEART